MAALYKGTMVVPQAIQSKPEVLRDITRDNFLALHQKLPADGNLATLGETFVYGDTSLGSFIQFELGATAVPVDEVRVRNRLNPSSLWKRLGSADVQLLANDGVTVVWSRRITWEEASNPLTGLSFSFAVA